MQHVAFSGLKRSGKDTAADYLIATRGFIKYSLASPLKDACRIIFLFEEDQLQEGDKKEIIDPRWGFSPRQSLQIVGTELFRDELAKHLPIGKGEIWKKRFLLWFEKQKKENPLIRIVIPDCRFPDEEEFLKSLGFLIVRIERQDLEEQKSNHRSESMIASVKTDTKIVNNGYDLIVYYQEIEDKISALIQRK